MLSILSMPTSNCPFRLVDEINQGMDKYNEHSVMKAVKEIIDESAEGEVCQFFILTPKVKNHFLINLQKKKQAHNFVWYFQHVLAKSSSEIDFSYLLSSLD